MASAMRPPGQIIVARRGDSLMRELQRREIDPQNVFFKYRRGYYRLAIPFRDLHGGTRIVTSPFQKFNEHPDSVLLEYAMLCGIHKVVPENVATPLALVKDRNGYVVGYVLRYVEGSPGAFEPLPKEIGNIPQEKFEVIRKLMPVIYEMQAHSVGHNDLDDRNKNVIIAAQDGRVVLIDPWPEGAIDLRDAFEHARRHDRLRFETAIINGNDQEIISQWKVLGRDLPPIPF